MAIAGYTITADGQKLLTAATASGGLIFTRGALGSGALAAGSDAKARTDMVNRISDMTISSVTARENTTRVVCQFTNVNGQGGYLDAFRWNESGLFGKLGESGTEKLIAYANTFDAGAGDLIPDTACEFEIAFELQFTGAEDARFSGEGLVFATLTQLATKANLSHMQSADTVTAGTLAGAVTANGTAIAALEARQVRNIVVASTEPVGCVNGDVWLNPNMA